MNRRDFLMGAGAALSTLWVPDALADVTANPLSFDLTRGSRVLHLYRPATRERLKIEYLRDGVWSPNAYAHLCWMLRDVQAGVHVKMDTRLIAILDWTQRFLAFHGYTDPLHVLSGYRTPHTNANTEGAKKNSQHLLGRAVDLRVPGLSSDYLGKLFRWLAQGGVGTYQSKEFVHLDTGPVRDWRS